MNEEYDHIREESEKMINEEKLEKSTQEASDIWLDSLPSDEELPDPEFSEDYQKKMSKLLAGQQNRRKSHLWRYVAAVAAVALIVSAVVVPFPSLVTGGRSAKEVDFTDPNEVYDLMLELTYFSYSKYEKSDLIMAELATGYIPEDMEWVASLEDCARLSRGVCYASEDAEAGQYFVISQQLAKENEDYVLLVDTDKAEQKKVDINGVAGTLYLEDNLVSIVWESVSEQEDTWVMVINGTLSQEELLKVAEKITLSTETTVSDSDGNSDGTYDNDSDEPMVDFFYSYAGVSCQFSYSLNINGKNIEIEDDDLSFNYAPENNSDDENTNADSKSTDSEAEVEELSEQEQSLNSELQEQMESMSLELQEQIQKLELQLQENKEMLDTLTMQLEDLTAAIVSLESEEDASEEVLSELKTQQELVEKSITSQEEMLATINETIESLQEQLDVLAEE